MVDETWLEEIYPAMLAFFRRHLPAASVSESEDFCHETLLACCQLLDRDAGGIANPVAYAFGIARNLLADARAASNPPLGRRTITVEQIADNLVAKSACPEKILVEQENRRTLERAIGRLTPTEERLIRLLVFEEIRHAEACRRIGVPPQAGSHLRHQAIRKLRFQLRLSPRPDQAMMTSSPAVVGSRARQA